MMTTRGHEQEAASNQVTGAGPAELSVVIVTYRNAAEIASCLRSISLAASPVSMEVIVVDNSSGDGTAAAARAALPSARVIERQVNDGFAGGCRVGADMATGQWLLFLNPDAVIAPDTVEALLGCARRHPDAGIVGGRFVHADGSADPRSWWGKPSVWSLLCFALGLTSLLHGNAVFDPESSRPWSAGLQEDRPAPIVTGALMLVRRDLWDELGGFDRAFFMYGEDTDFCLRAVARGYRPMVTAKAVCVHEGGKSSSTNAGKLIMVFTGKVTVVHRDFPTGLRGVSVGLLLAGVGLRAVAGRFASSASPARQGRPTTRGEDWQGLWAARAQWRGGWGSRSDIRASGGRH
jgi:N-acetylglucosaminyl-diphospho-decaprenol L-rhamnosyltransferase